MKTNQPKRKPPRGCFSFANQRQCITNRHQQLGAPGPHWRPLSAVGGVFLRKTHRRVGALMTPKIHGQWRSPHQRSKFFRWCLITNKGLKRRCFIVNVVIKSSLLFGRLQEIIFQMFSYKLASVFFLIYHNTK
jgi:hypothetical protein